MAGPSGVGEELPPNVPHAVRPCRRAELRLGRAGPSLAWFTPLYEPTRSACRAEAKSPGTE